MHPNTPGAQLWARRYNGTANSGDAAYAMGVSPDGTKVFVTGESQGTGSGPDYATVAYDASSGMQLWDSRYDGPASSGDAALSLGVSPDGTAVYVTGTSYGSGTGADFATLAYDASTGGELWVSRYDGPAKNIDFGTSLGVSPDGTKLFVTGESAGSGTGVDYATVAYDASTGTQLWVSRYDGPGGLVDEAFSLGVSPDGARVFVTGETGGSTSEDYTTIAYDAITGTRLWARRYNGPANADDIAQSLAVSPDGTEVVVTGRSDAANAYTDYATMAYETATGAGLWVRRYNGPANSEDEAFSSGVSPDGTTAFVTGESIGSSGSFDYATIAYDAATGANRWVRRYNGAAGEGDEAFSLGVSPDGTEVFVTGLSFGVTSKEDVATVAYDAATGAGLWLRRFNGGANGNDAGSSLGVSPDGTKVFVAGQSYGATSDYDYITIAYSAV